METLETILGQKRANFACKNCDYKCSKKYDLERHLKTKKHILSHNGNDLEILETFLPQKSAKSATYICDCGKKYATNSGLWKHTKICNKNKNYNIHETTDKDLIMLLIKENSELKNVMLDHQNMMMKVIENGSQMNNSHNTSNSHNKTFNLQFFLNETCKDAMNIMDFVDSIKLQLSDLEKVGQIGYVEGISNIITSNLKALDVSQRPIHCADKKREVLYIKDENKWEKEDEEKSTLRKAIKKVVSKNQRLLPMFKQEHPDCIKSTSPFSDQYNKMIVESMGGSGDNDLEKEDKIIRNISKNVVIDK